MLPKEIRCRRDTYRSYEKAARSFAKFICKQGWYSPLVKTEEYGLGLFVGEYFRLPTTYSHGYPQFTARGKSQALHAWNEVFLPYRDEADSHYAFIRWQERLLDEQDESNRFVAARKLCNGTVLKPNELPEELVKLQVVMSAAKTLLTNRRITKT